jgi:hypothetical protein
VLTGSVGSGHAEAVGSRGQARDSIGSIPRGLVSSEKSALMRKRSTHAWMVWLGRLGWLGCLVGWLF